MLGPVELVGVELLGEVLPGVDLERGVAPVWAGAGQPHVQVGLHRVHTWPVMFEARDSARVYQRPKLRYFSNVTT